MSFWTIACNGVEKSFADWNHVQMDFTRERDNKGRGTVILQTMEVFDPGALQWLAQQPATIWRDRTAVGAGGTIWAQGYFDDPERCWVSGRQFVRYRLHNVWWLLEQHFYQQPRYVVTAISGSPPVKTLSNMFTPEVFLGEAVVPGEVSGYTTLMQTNGAEITEILNWVNECFNPTKRGATTGRSDTQDVLTVGTIEPQLFTGIKRVAAILCSEAVIEMLRLQPDSLVWVDETTVPPTVNVRTLGKWNYGTTPPTFVDYTNLDEVALTITAEQERRILAQGQTWKQLPAVVIWWWGTNEIGSATVPFAYVDDFPNGLDSNNMPVDGFVPRASVHFIVIAGSRETIAQAEVNTEALSALIGGDQAAQVAWWKAHDPTLADPKIDAATISVGTPTVLDDSGAAINTTDYPNILLDSSLPSWADAVGLRWAHATIRAEVAFTRYADAGHLVVDTKVQTRLMHKRVKVTNAVTRTYMTTTSFTPGDWIPQGVAESVYRSTNAPQWAGEIEFVAGQLRSDIMLGKRYRLIGPNTTFYNILPQKILERPCEGSVSLMYGPAPVASIDALLELSRATRFRNTWRLPSGRDTGDDAGQAPVDTGNNAPTDDTAHGTGGAKLAGTTFNDTI